MTRSRCDEALGPGARCVLPAGHDGPHTGVVQLPPEVARLIAHGLNSVDSEREGLNRVVRRYQFGLILVIAASLLNVAAAVFNLLSS